MAKSHENPRKAASLSYWHTEMRSSGASVGLRRGQVRMVGGGRYILLRPSQHAGEWVVGHYGDGITVPAETRRGSTLRACPVIGRVLLTVREGK